MKENNYFLSNELILTTVTKYLETWGFILLHTFQFGVLIIGQICKGT